MPPPSLAARHLTRQDIRRKKTKYPCRRRGPVPGGAAPTSFALHLLCLFAVKRISSLSTHNLPRSPAACPAPHVRNCRSPSTAFRLPDSQGHHRELWDFKYFRRPIHSPYPLERCARTPQKPNSVGPNNTVRQDMHAVALLVILFVLFAAISLVTAFSHRRSEEERRGWRIRCEVAGRWAYEEKIDGTWSGFTFDELGDYRESPYVIDVRDSARWEACPAWARERRQQILARIASQLRPPHYHLKEMSEGDLALSRVVSMSLSPRIACEDRPVI